MSHVPCPLPPMLAAHAHSPWRASYPAPRYCPLWRRFDYLPCPLPSAVSVVARLRTRLDAPYPYVRMQIPRHPSCCRTRRLPLVRLVGRRARQACQARRAHVLVACSPAHVLFSCMSSPLGHDGKACTPSAPAGQPLGRRPPHRSARILPVSYPDLCAK
jgi:hypothetical protein